MRSQWHVFLIFVFFLVIEATSIVETPTLHDVATQITEFLEITQNGKSSPWNGSLAGCSLACSFLSYASPGHISYPNSEIYRNEESLYWSVQQASTLPRCRFTPESAVDVSLGVLAVQVTQCQFAVKSGGHAPFFGASNIDGGIAFDLLNLNQVEVSPDQTVTAVGAGNLWVDVYSILEKSNLTVIGGREAGIGAGGLTLGGGISFFSSRYGWACDNVNAYEVVFADGTIHKVTYTSYPDLYFALRGGGNNFGIVTRFDMATYPQGELWAGQTAYLYNETTAKALDAAFYNFNINAPEDPYAQVIYVFGYVQSINSWVIQPELQYGKPEPYPAILKNFTDVPYAVPITTSFKVINHSALTIEFNNNSPSGFRQTFSTLMVKNNPSLIKEIVSIYMSEITPVENITGLLPTLIFQPIPTTMTSHFSKNGGNALGISESDGPLNLINLSTTWSDAADDERIYAVMGSIIERANATAYAQGAGYPYLYMNYAAQQQNVVRSYGEENSECLRETSRKYDPDGVWQNLLPGGFKLGL